MSLLAHNSQELARMYAQRFDANTAYRDEVWKVLTREYFQKWVKSDATVLDLGCGYGEFIRNIDCNRKYGMDLNATARKYLPSSVEFICQDCSQVWPVEDESLDVIFSSNFFEHLPDKRTLSQTLRQAHRCLRLGGTLIAMGPNIKLLRGKYWDFWDHSLPLSEASLAEGLHTHFFDVVTCHSKFLPYTMVGGPQWPLFLIRTYLKLPFIWSLFGKQFLITATKGDLLARDRVG